MAEMTRASVCKGLGPADALELPLLEDAEDLGLGRQGQLADLVEKDGAAGRALEPAGLLAVGSGESTALVAEKLALDQPSGSAPQLTRMNGPAARSEWRWKRGRRPAPCRCRSRPTIKTGGVGRGGEADRP